MDRRGGAASLCSRLWGGTPPRPAPASPSPAFHIASAALHRPGGGPSHKAAAGAGGAGSGPPGLRRHYGPTYYAAFVIDPDGHRLEAVFK